MSKNYLTEREVRELNRLTSILLDIFEDQLDLGRLVVMNDATRLLDEQLANLGRVVLRTGGRVSAEVARQKAQDEYEKFSAIRRNERISAAIEEIAALAKEAKKLPRTRE